MRPSTLSSIVGLIALFIFSANSRSQNGVAGPVNVEHFSSAESSMQSSLSPSKDDKSIQENSVPQTSISNSQAVSTKSWLAPFTTDGCSMWIDGPPNQPWLWRHCCVAHDRAYWIGGTAAERRKSDQDLQKCITDVAGKFMGDSMYMGVMPGGSPYWVTPYRWGYGWSYFDAGKLRGYKSLNEDELAQANALIPDAEEKIAFDAIDHPANFRFLMMISD